MNNTDNTLQQFTDLPAGLLDVAVENLHQLIPQPALFHLPGRRSDTLFISVLLHGNEPTGFLALQRLLQKYRQQTLPRSLSLFFGNTQAARLNQRRLNGQPDFNRVWPGTALADSPERQWAEQITAAMRRRELFASIDVHNNTGLNPHYACLNKLDNDFLQLGALFGRLLVHFTHPKGTQSAAFAEFCPAVTLECGRPGQEYGTEHAFEFLDSCLHLTEIPPHPVVKQNIDIYHTVAQITIAENTTFSFSDETADLYLSTDLERMNFTAVSTGTALGKIHHDRLPVLAKNEHGDDVTSRFFSIDAQQLVITRPAMPSMLTLDERVIRQDCLCYLMERLEL
ncbi:MAG: M14 family metallopeptidase [Gammaproteobacteria bacterium]